jgi:hypothetical protein
MAIGGHQVGPVTQDGSCQLAQRQHRRETLVFTAGMTTWQKVKEVPASPRSSRPGSAGQALPRPCHQASGA